MKIMQVKAKQGLTESETAEVLVLARCEGDGPLKQELADVRGLRLAPAR